MGSIDSVIEQAKTLKATAKAKLVEKREKLQAELDEIDSELLEIDLAWDRAFARGNTTSGKRGRKTGQSVQVALNKVKEAILSVLKKAKDEWITTMDLSKAIKVIVPDAEDVIIGRAKLELFEAKEIKRKGEKRGASYHVA